MKLDDALNIGWWMCLLVALAGCATPIVAVPIILNIPWARITTLQGLEERTHAEFPEGTALLEARYARSIDGAGFAKLSVPRERVPELLNTTVFAEAPRSQSERNLTTSLYYGAKTRNEPIGGNLMRYSSSSPSTHSSAHHPQTNRCRPSLI